MESVRGLLQHLRVSIRNFSRTPGFAATSILTLALGIGLATAVFTVADALLLRRLPVRDQDRIVVLWGEGGGRDRGFTYPLGLDDARDFARQARSLEQVAFVSYYGAFVKPIRDGDQVSPLARALVSGQFFDVLGARPILGRGLSATDDVSGAAPVAILSYAIWQRRFGGDSTILGRQLVTYDDGVAYTIVGVMPQGLDYPRGTGFWAPVVPSNIPKDMYVLGRLAPGATTANVRNELTAFFARPTSSPWQHDLRGVAYTLPRLVLGETRPALLVFAAAAGLLLLITCINVANLQLVRGLARVREVAVRSALGAGRGRIIGQLLIESGLLAIAGCALGLAVASGAVQLFVTFAPSAVPRLDEIALNTTALGGAVGITVVAMLIFALAPAVITSRVELDRVLRSDSRQSATRHSRRATEALVVGQVALALLVLTAAGLVARSLVKLERADLAFDPSRVLIGDLTLRYAQYGDGKKQLALLENVLSQVRRTPGVRAASPVVAVPFAGAAGWDGKLAVEGQSQEEAALGPLLNMEVVSPDYFATLGIPTRAGRVFTDADREGSQPVVVVSESAARLYWANDEPVGKRVRMGENLEHTLTVVGVVPDTRYRDLRDARATVYFPLQQSFFPSMPMTLAVRTIGPPSHAVPAIRRAIAEAAPGVALASAAPFETFLEGPLAQPRLNALLLAVFAGAAVALAAVGLFGAMATMVRLRTRELGIRMALGATTRELRGMVVRRGLRVAALGSALGVIGALLTNRFLGTMLYDVAPTDLPTLFLVTAFLIGVSMLASLIPARATSRIDPMVALRTE